MSVSVTHYMLCMVGSGLFILHAIAQTFIIKHGWTSGRPVSRHRVIPVEALDSKLDLDIVAGTQAYDNTNKLNMDIAGGAKIDMHSSEGVMKTFRQSIVTRCSFVVLMDIVSFLICLCLNVAGYIRLVNTYITMKYE